jgi:hypothetical protein
MSLKRRWDLSPPYFTQDRPRHLPKRTKSRETVPHRLRTTVALRNPAHIPLASSHGRYRLHNSSMQHCWTELSLTDQSSWISLYSTSVNRFLEIWAHKRFFLFSKPLKTYLVFLTWPFTFLRPYPIQQNKSPKRWVSSSQNETYRLRKASKTSRKSEKTKHAHIKMEINGNATKTNTN